MAQRILVTGATGFVGRHCLEELNARTMEVHAVTSRRWPNGHDEVAWHTADLQCPHAVQRLMHAIRPTHLLHLAWTTAPGQFWSSPDNLAWTEASVRLLRMFHQTGGQRVVMAGSCAEYDWQFAYLREDHTPIAPRTLYGTCKHAVHQVLESFARENGLCAAWARLFFLYGPYGSPRRMPGCVIEALIHDQSVHCSDGQQIRDYLHVRDAARALVKLVTSDAQGTFNIGSGQGVRIRDLVLHVADHFRNSRLIHLGAHSANENDPPVLVADIERLKSQLNWNPTIPLRTGLTSTCQWWERRLRTRAA